MKPKRARRGARTPEDWADAIRRGTLTLESICGYLELEIPPELEPCQRQQLPRISASARSTRAGMVYFAYVKDEAGRKRVETAFARGALCVVCNKTVVDKDGEPYPCIICKHPMDDAARVAALVKEGKRAKCVAITGSVGKTSTKEMLRRVAETHCKTGYSKSNQNGFGPVVRNIQNIEPGTEVFIQETGLSRPGSIRRPAMALKPDAFVITNIGLNHVGYFDGDQMGILREKLMLDVHAAPDAVGFVNWDDPLLRAASYQHRIVRYAIDATDADYFARDVVERNGQISFRIVEAATGAEVPCTLSVIGRHNVGNALCAYAFGSWLGVPQGKILEALREFRTTGVRQNLTYLAGQHVYLDCYNASEGAVRSVMEAMGTIDVPAGAKRVLVFGDIDDKLGTRTEEVHRRLGRDLAACPAIDLLLCFGEHAAWTAEEAAAGGLEVRATMERAQLEAWISGLVGADDLLAFKGGQQMMLAKTVDNLFGTPFFSLDRDVIDQVSTAIVTRGELEFRVLDDYGVEVRGQIRSNARKSLTGAMKQAARSGLSNETITIPDAIEGIDVRTIGKNALTETSATSIVLPARLRTIDSMAFHRALKLREVELPDTVEYIGPKAFASCTSLRELAVPEGVTTIGGRAFSNCLALRRVSLPASVKTMGEDVFSQSPRVRISCPVGSYAHAYCMKRYPGRVIGV